MDKALINLPGTTVLNPVALVNCTHAAFLAVVNELDRIFLVDAVPKNHRHLHLPQQR